MSAFATQPLSGSCQQIRYMINDYYSSAFHDTNLSCQSQPIQAFEHESFQNMIHTAARATNGVKIPDRRQTRQAIIDKFKQQLTALRDRLNVWEIPYHCHHWLISIVLRVIQQRER